MNELTTLEQDPRTAIVWLLENDPRLILKHTTRQYKADLFHFEEWRAARPITKHWLRNTSRSSKAKAERPTQ